MCILLVYRQYTCIPPTTQIKGTARAIHVILPYVAANYYGYLAQWSNSDTTLVCVTIYCGDTNQLTHPYKCCME